jgi:hypothetical protein
MTEPMISSGDSGTVTARLRSGGRPIPRAGEPVMVPC